MKRPYQASLGENQSPKLCDDKLFGSPNSDELVSKAKRKRIGKEDLDSSIDLFGSPGMMISLKA